MRWQQQQIKPKSCKRCINMIETNGYKDAMPGDVIIWYDCFPVEPVYKCVQCGYSERRYIPKPYRKYADE